MGYSDKCINLVKQSEGLRLKAYRDYGGKLTIGFGHTGPDVTEGLAITEDQANALLKYDLDNAYRTMMALVKVPMTQGQIDALTDFVFNLGSGNFKSSTLLVKLNAQDYDGASEELLKWCMAGGKQLAGLFKRRKVEQALFRA